MPFFLFFASLLWAAEPEGCILGKVSTPSLRVRTSPDLSGSTAGRLKRGEQVEVKVYDLDWVEILSGAQKGQYASRSHFVFSFSSRPECREQAFEGKVTKNGVNFRSEPSLSGRVRKANAKAGASLEVKPSALPWVEVVAPKELAGLYLHSDYFSLEDIALPLPKALREE